MAMKSYQTSWGHYIAGVFTLKPNQACWSGTHLFYKQAGAQLINEKADNTIYIYNYECPETIQYTQLLIDIINEFNTCHFVIIDGRIYIKFELLKTYDQSLVLLNFIRNLWYAPGAVENYTKLFFEYLQASVQEDPLSRLTEANLLANTKNKASNGAHCNVFAGSLIKTVKQLHAYTGNTVFGFITK